MEAAPRKGRHGVVLESVSGMGMKDEARAELIPELLRETRKNGGLTRPMMERVAERLGLPREVVEEAATFYPAFTAPRARWHVRVCKSLSCHLEEGRAVYTALQKALRGAAGGAAALERVNCLGLCGRGPAMTINGRAYTALTPAKAVTIALGRVKSKAGRL